MFKFFLHSFSSTSNCLNDSPSIRPSLKNHPIISNRKSKCPFNVPNFPFFFILTVAIFLILSSNLPMANALGRRRMCGQVLTQELARICTKPGTRGPCLHGHIQTPTKRGGFFSESQQLAPKFAHQMLRFLQPREFYKRTNKRMVAEENDVAHFGQNFHLSLKTTPNNHRLNHPFLHLMLRKPINSPAEYSSSFLEPPHHRPKRDGGGIAHHCCTGNGCDDAFLDSFCCDEEEEKAFRAINS